MGTGWTVSGSGATRTYSYTPGSATPGTQSVTASNGAGATASSSFTVTSDSTAPTTTILCNGVACLTGTYYTSSPVHVTLSANDGTGSGVQRIRYTTDGTDPSPVNGNDYIGTIDVSTTTTIKFRSYDNVGNEEAVGSQTILFDTTPPTGPTLTLTENPNSAGQYVSGTTLFYRPGSTGTFRVGAATSDPETGIASVSFPAIANVTGGGSVTSAPYQSDYTWNSTTSDAASHNVVATNGSGMTSSASFTLTPDSTAPTSQSITLTGVGAPYYNGAVTFSLGDGSDSGAGLDTTSRTVTRASAPLSGDSCGTFTADPGTYTSPDSSVSGGHCYRYTFTIADNVGNVSAGVSATAKVDSAGPTVAVTAPTAGSGASSQWWDGSTKTLFFRPSSSGSFTLNATASDAETAVTGVTFPDVSGTSGWGGSTGGTDTTSPYSSPTTYSWTSGAAQPGVQSVTATDKVGNTGSDNITLEADGTAPTGQTITLTGGTAPWYTGSSVTFALGDGSDDVGGSGLDTATRTVTRETATLAGATCGSFSSDPGTFTSPDNSVSGGHCYRYTFTIADHVGNVSAPVSVIAKVDASAPTVSVTAPTELTGNGSQYYDSTTQTQWFRPSSSGSFALNATASDPESGIAQVAFPDVSGTSGWSGSTGGTDTTSPYSSPSTYSWTSGAAAPGAKSITATDGAGLSGNASVTIAADSTAPAGQSITLTGPSAPYYKTASVSFSLANGTDAQSGLDLSSSTVTRASAPLSGDSCGTFTADPGTYTSPDTSVSGGHCYRYSFAIADNVGNVSSAVTAVAKVDTAAPSVTVSAPTELTGTGNQYYDSATKTQFFRSTGSGSFALNATASDVDTSVTQVAFPDISATSGWSGSTGGTDTTSPYASPTTYAWTSGAGAPGAVNVTATDKAGNTANDTITLKDDTTAPTGQTITLTGASAPYYTTPSVTFSLADGTDNPGGSGVDPTSRTVTRETAPLTANACGTFTADPGTFTSPDTSVSGGHCYRYTFVESDNVGNQTAGTSVTAEVDTTGPTVNLSDPGSPFGGTITLNATASDSDTGVAQVVFQRSPAGASTWTTIATDTSAPYSANWDTTSVADGAYDLRAVATNGAGASATSIVTNRQVDNTPPDTSIDSHPANPSNNPNPTFTFSSTEAGSTFACRLDGGAWAPCTSPDTLPTLAEASHTFDVRATDAAGNTDPTPASYTWTVDNTPPDTSIDSAPANPSNNPNPSFTFSATKPGSTFQCRVDGGAWTACASPDTLGTLTEGSHTFDVRATDGAGNTDPTPATLTWTIDLTPPTIAITSPTQYVNGTDPVDYPVTASTPDSDVAKVDFYECSDASVGCATGTWNIFASDTSAPFDATWTTPVTDGPKAIEAVATDDAGNTGAAIRTITIDRTAPTGVTVSYPSGYASGPVTITTSNGSDPDVNPSSGVLERQTAALTNDTCGAFGSFSTVSSPDTVPSGECAMYRYSVADNAGNVAAATSPNVVKSDTVAPTSAIADPGTNLRATITLNASASDSGGSTVASVAFQRRPSGGGSWTTIGTDSTAPYSTSFDTTTVPDGAYDFRSVATDGAGNIEASPVPVTNRVIDNTAPSATMLSPGNPVKGTVTLSSNTSDSGSGLASVTYEIAPHGGSFSSQSATWDTTSVADGLYDLRVVATDVAGNTTISAPVTTRVDNTPPSLFFTSPASNAVVSGTVALTATASDAAPASPTVTFEYKLHSAPASAYASTPASWNTLTLPAGDGVYDLRATATDDAGNVTRVENTSIVVDNAPPTVAITAPPAAINGSVPSPTPFSANASDSGSGVAQVEFFDCSDTSTDCSTGTWNSLGTVAAPGPYTVNWNVPSDGNHALRAVATDNAGHTASAIRNVDIDRTPPDTTITSHPADPSSATPTFTFDSTEPGSTFECRVDGGAWAACTSPKTFAGLTDNLHTVDVRAIDPAGNVDPTPATWTWHRDTTAPTATMDDPGRNVRGTVTLTASGSDPTSNGYASGIASVEYDYSADGTTWAPIGTLTSPPFGLINWATSGIADGVYELRVVVTDVAGNTTISTPVTNVRIDNTPPTTSQDDPGPYLHGTETITGSAADTGSGVDHVDFQIAPAGSGSWTTYATDTTAPYSVSLDTTALADGHYDFQTVAYDAAGNQATSTPVTDRLIDNTPPTATMTSPGPYARGTISLSSTTDDPGGANASGLASTSYEYSTNGGTSWTPTGSSLNTTTLPDGNVELRVTATDHAGNSTTSTPVTTLVDNTKPVTTDDAPSGWQSTAVVVHLTATDAGSGVNVTEYSVDGGPFVTGTTVTIPAPADGSNDGTHTIAYFSADNAGNIEQVKSTQVLIDATPPVCPSCSAADYLRGTVTLNASPSDSGAGIQSVTFQYSPAGADTWTTIGTDSTGPAPYHVDWDTTSVPDGHYDLQILVTDNANNTTATDLPDKVVDNTAPNVAVIGAPTEGATVSGNVDIAASAADATSPIASVQFFVRGVSVGTDTTAPYDLTWNSTAVSDGPAQIYAVVTDMAGNSTTSPIRTITVDNHAPSPTLADPGQNVEGTITLNATSDPDTAQVDFEVRPAGGSTWSIFGTDTSAPYSASLDTTTLADGLYDFRVEATDGSGNNGTSAIRANVRVDNTAPTGSLTAPTAGATVGGSSVNLAATVSDSGSGVASVRYEERPTGGASFAPITTSTSAPFGGSWDTSGLASGSYDLRIVVTDRAGNTFTGSPVTVTVDAAAPTVVLQDPGSTLSGTVNLNATVTGSGATHVVFEWSPAGANAWHSISTDSTAPYGATFDTTHLPDGMYDLRATVSDSVGNTSSSLVTGIRVDNQPPRIVSTDPADGSTIDAASSIQLVTSEPVTMQDVLLDGKPTVAPVINGTQVSYGTGALSDGLHVLTGTLRDAAGKTSQFTLSFTVWKQGTPGTPPPTQGNTTSSGATTLGSADGVASVTTPPGAWSPNGSDWLIIRITPAGTTTPWNGFVPGTEVLDVTAHWALSGIAVHEFNRPLDILIHASGNQLIPATREDSTGDWTVMRPVPNPPTLPDGWSDGYYTDSAGFHLLTHHLSQFTLLKDVQAPSAPTDVRGYLLAGQLALTWTPGTDNSGTYDHVSVMANGTTLGDFGTGITSGDVGPYSAGDNRSITLDETDFSGNTSSQTAALLPVPSLVGKPLSQVEDALTAAGFKIGTVTEDGSGAPGTVTGPGSLVYAQPGATINLTIATGSGDTKFVFGVVGSKRFRTLKHGSYAVRFLLTRKAQITGTLYGRRNLRLYTWTDTVPAGRTITKLHIPRQLHRAHMYSIRWTAVSGGDTVRRTMRVRFVRTRAAWLGPARPLDIVVAGDTIPQNLPISGVGERKGHILRADGVDHTFTLTAARSRNVRVVVVDVDEYGLSLVHQLHVVFPAVRIIAVSRQPSLRAAALKVGASSAMRSSAPPSRLVAMIERLAKKR
ncbi:MAG TPA: Ig-like domain-containing protein [Gaiellaceae bacterium]|nr:Ig-like domain-containing protein [Gaiellaceae bacterium]